MDHTKQPPSRPYEGPEEVYEKAADELENVERDFGEVHLQIQRLNLDLMDRDVQGPDGSRLSGSTYWRWRLERERVKLGLEQELWALKIKRRQAERRYFAAKRELDSMDLAAWEEVAEKLQVRELTGLREA